ncbi:cytidine deaminase [Fulvivirga sediminis]|uniref:Cytidine deaminase n=1 Tax=Fulvivirga sediminis TaxID=2803949 RepID=A0A937K1A9_9BACT|nr:cytidine deaminase [Fulvivirga sediminis]MBL3656457.1 cytidine deaminase [Fulvivirga sediminis]
MEQEIIEDKGHSTYSYADLNEQYKKLIKKAQEACDTSYSPYSKFKVGAAILLDNGEILTGSNQENSCYPAGLCAERVVLFFAGANYSNHIIKQIAITAKRWNDDQFLPISPCGGCRQVLLETEVKQESPIKVILQSPENQWIVTNSSEVLLPFGFNKHSL